MKLSNTYVGTELKMHIGFDYQDGKVTLDDLPNFIVEFFCTENRVQRFEKKNKLFIVDNGEYYACVDTNITGPGNLKMKMTAYIPENDYFGNDFYRSEVAVCNTNVRILETGYK